MHVYLLVPCSVQGPGIKLISTQAGPRPGAAPLALRAGLLTWHLPDGPLHAQLLDSHRHLAEEAGAVGSPAQRRSRSGSGKWAQQVAAAAAAAAASSAGMPREELLTARCQEALALCHFERALAAAQQLGEPGLLREVALDALQFLEVPAAMAAYEAAGDGEALEQLRPLVGLEDGNLLAGQVVALTGGAWVAGVCRSLGWYGVHRHVRASQNWVASRLAPSTSQPSGGAHLHPTCCPQATQTVPRRCCWPPPAPRPPWRCGAGWATGSARWAWRSSWSRTPWVGWRCCGRRRWRLRARCAR